MAQSNSVKLQAMSSATRNYSMTKNASKSVVQWDATTLLVMALLIRAAFLVSLAPWLGTVKSYELQPIISKYSHTYTRSLTLDATHSNEKNRKITTKLHSTMTDYMSTTNVARKSDTTDEILKGTSTTTQLLLQTPPEHHRRQETFVDVKDKPSKDRTLYEILGSAPNATKEELKRQYIIMAKLTHPDALISRQGIGNNERFPAFTEVADAYHILSNPLERKKYDRTMHSTQMIQMMVLLGDICIGTTLTMAEITTTIVWVTLMVVLQPIAVHVTTELFYLSIDD